MQNLSLVLRHFYDLARSYRWFALSVASAVFAIGTILVHVLPERHEARARVYVESQSVLGPLLKDLSVPINEEQEIASTLSKLVIAEDALKQFKSANLGQLPGQSGDFYQQNASLEKLLRETQLELSQLISAKQAMANHQTANSLEPGSTKEPEPRPAARPKPLLSPNTLALERAVLEAQRHLAGLNRKYTQEHPDVKQAQLALDDLQQELSIVRSEDIKLAASIQSNGDEISKQNSVQANRSIELKLITPRTKWSTEDIDGQIAASRVRLADAQTRLDALKARAGQAPSLEADLDRLSRDYEILKAQLDKLKAKQSALNISAQADQSASLKYHLIDPAYVLPQPVSPNKTVLLGLVILGAFASSAGAVMLRDHLRPLVHRMSTLRNLTEVPLFGYVSLVIASQEQTKYRVQSAALGLAWLALICVMTSVFAMQAKTLLLR